MKKWQFSNLEAMFWGGCGTILSLLFAYDMYMPRCAGVAAIFAVAIWVVATSRASRLSLLQRLMIVLYVLPFSVMISYFVAPDYIWESIPIRVELLSDPTIVAQTLSIGLVGLLGMVAGMRLAESLRRRRGAPPDIVEDRWRVRLPCLGGVQFLLLLAVAMIMCYSMNSDSATIFTRGYAGTRGLAQKMNFSAAGLLSYLVVILLFIDAECEALVRRRLKMLTVEGGTIFSVVYFELIRGNRDAIGLITALMALYLTGSAAPPPKEVITRVMSGRKRLRKLLVPALATLLIYVAVTPLRTRLSDPSADRLSVSDMAAIGFLERSTWSSVLLTNVGSAYFYSMGDIEYLYGQTYLDYMLSLPPGAVSRLFNYERPLERYQGPNYWFQGIGRGGIHPVCVPFHNFGILGVLIIMGGIGMFIVWVDNPTASAWRRLLYAAVIAGAFKWFWYGDMTLFRSLMGAVLLWGVYVFLVLTSRSRAVRDRRDEAVVQGNEQWHLPQTVCRK